MRSASVVAVFAVMLLAACTADDATPEPPAASGTSIPIPTPAPTPAPTNSPVADDVTFTFKCGYFAADGTATTIPEELLSLGDAWAHEPATAWCQPIQHGTEFTVLQHEAVALAGDVLPDGITQVGGLYAQCAMRANGYLKLTSLAPNQAQEVRGFLHICPDRPGADYLRAMLGG
ncbi:MAG: hypothetical protein DI534_11430 [Leifsonia xyli]|nr:MAG: hypothetical protein DI534_11430 [Leifsonia xyli]